MRELPQVETALFLSRRRALRFTAPTATVCAQSVAEVGPCLDRLNEAVSSGHHVAGYIAFEAAPAFDTALRAHEPDDLPLLCFGVYEGVNTTDLAAETIGSSRGRAGFELGDWRPLVSESAYAQAIRRIRERIAAGDTYQVNYTFPLETTFRGDALAWFSALCAGQNADFCGFIDAGRFKILSASPELFFRLHDNVLETRPMKGTRPRGLWVEEDRRLAAELAASEKDRAENVMIVDLLRNDMGKISDRGSVAVRSLFDIERYETVWQMTSTIVSQTNASLPAILDGLFPSGSVTGAPKVRTMEIIRDLEPHPRGVYCGAVGWWSPPRSAEFNVAIRTAAVDTQTGLARYHVGGGITWGSTAQGEYDECLAKAVVLTYARPSFDLLESILWEGDYFLLDEHMKRLSASADYFGYAADAGTIAAALRRKAAGFRSGPLKVRLLTASNGTYRIEAAPAPVAVRVRLGLAPEPVNERDVLLYHKTTHREVYDKARATRPDCNDVLLCNRRGELTESTTANIVLDMEGRLVTPPVRSGLLAGVMRNHLLATGQIAETVLTPSDLGRARAVYLINSIRKWIEVDLRD